MRTLQVLTLVLTVLIGTSLSSCKKDNPQKSQHRIKSITTVEAEVSRKTEFYFDDKGLLKQTRQYKNGSIEVYTDYEYSAGKITAAKTYEQLTDGAVRLCAQANFSHEGDRLSRVEISDVPAALKKFAYVFDYSLGDTLRVTRRVHRNGIPDYWTHPGSEEDDSSEWMTLPPLAADIKQDCIFDDKQNPLQGIPVLSVTYSVGVFKQISCDFDYRAFFLPNNLTSQKMDWGELRTSQYSYNAVGLPVKRVTTGNAATASRLEVMFDYGE
ncbi:hypothetical protein [Pedobacter deserti]|uniref:hypothetical protein n=1 Tax=Pedobacter deserti TaxID=2817382 RepID=UPI00210BE7C7|nr:hypothetical protein [Pedobacter sp. SYSU D00382]